MSTAWYNTRPLPNSAERQQLVAELFPRIQRLVPKLLAEHHSVPSGEWFEWCDYLTSVCGERAHTSYDPERASIATFVRETMSREVRTLYHRYYRDRMGLTDDMAPYDEPVRGVNLLGEVEFRQAIAPVVGGWTRKRQQVFWLLYDGHTLSSAAQLLGVTYQAVAQARNWIRKALEGWLEEQQEGRRGADRAEAVA